MTVARQTPKYLTDQLVDEGPNMALGSHEFYVNPQQIQITSTAVIYKNVTQAGVYFQAYTADVTVYKLVGTYSNAGMDEVKAAEHYAPQYQKGSVAYPFTFPPLGLHGRQVYVMNYTVSFEQGDPWYIHYQLELQELPLAQPYAPPSGAENGGTAKQAPVRGF